MSDCPICSYAHCSENRNKGSEFPGFDCPRCGSFYMTATLLADSRLPLSDYKLSAWVRNENEISKNPPEFSSYNLAEITENLPNYSPSEKLNLLLLAIDRKTEYPGFVVTLDESVDYPLGWAKQFDEFNYMLKSLDERGLIEFYSKALGTQSGIYITADGWDLLDNLQSSVVLHNQAFIAMSFSDDMETIWEDGIKPAVTEAGYSALRVDKVEHADRIDAKIIADIRESKFVVADVTQQKQGVYFEAGYAIGLGRPVIWTVQNGDLANVHFDTRQYNHIVWNNPSDLKGQLYNRIRAIIG